MGILNDILDSAEKRKSHKAYVSKKNKRNGKKYGYRALPDNNKIKKNARALKALEDEAIKNIQRNGATVNESIESK